MSKVDGMEYQVRYKYSKYKSIIKRRYGRKETAQKLFDKTAKQKQIEFCVLEKRPLDDWEGIESVFNETKK